jgi:hypothetical protein
MIFNLLINIINKINYKGDDIMALVTIYTTLIINGRRVFSKIPENLKADVAKDLISLGYENLIDDPNYLPKTEPQA